ncbi:unannotated protein [freshwater metagenome]|uniref:Unannotated protein n=1 Tax=freshwater metagenome TaxID=449393 RepID=A0A6J7RBP7_9ZZZZ
MNPRQRSVVKASSVVNAASRPESPYVAKIVGRVRFA